MLIIGHKEVDFLPFYLITEKEHIKKISSNSVVAFEYAKKNKDIINFCKENETTFALICNTIKDVILASANDASYLICDKAIVKEAQNFADEYMWDAKVLLYSNNEEDLLWCARNSIDGIIFEEGISYDALE